MKRLLAVAVLLFVNPTMVRAGGSPPVDIGFSFDIPANAGCKFPVNWTGTGKESILMLPGGRRIVTSQKQTTVVTNLADPSKSVTLNVEGALHVSFGTLGPQGEVMVTATGRTLLADPIANVMVLTIGTFKYMFDLNTGSPELIDLSGDGRLIDVCALIE